MALARTRMPEKYAREYFRELRRLIEADRKLMRRAFVDEIQPRIHEYRAEIERIAANVAGPAGHLRVNDALHEIRRVIERLRDNADRAIFAGPVIERLARQFVEQTDRYIRISFRQQVSRILGFDPTANEPWLRSFLETAVHENVSWIKSIAAEQHNRVEAIILQGVRRGESINDMAQRIAEVGDVSLKRARFIARDQMGSLHGDLVKARQTRLGLKRFIWWTAADERVRDEHAELHGQIFDWATGAEVDGRKIWPGTDYNCYDDETEVLTVDGFRLFRDLTGDELIATLVPDTGEIEYLQPVQRIQYPYRGPMLEISSWRTSLCVTPDHWLVYASKWGHNNHREWPLRFKRAKDAVAGDALPRTAKWGGKEAQSITVGGKQYDARLFMRFLGWYLAEGSTTAVDQQKSPRRFRYQISIHQEPGPNHREIAEICRALFGRVWVGKDKVYVIEDSLAERLIDLGKSHEKRIPPDIKQLSRDLLAVFLDAFCKGDGRTQTHRTIGFGGVERQASIQPIRFFYTSSPQLADDIGELLLKTGRYPSFSVMKHKGKTVTFKNGDYVINHDIIVVAENKSHWASLRPPHIKWSEYDGQVYCLEMPRNHTLYVRRRGKCIWCGNCRCVAQVVEEDLLEVADR